MRVPGHMLFGYRRAAPPTGGQGASADSRPRPRDGVTRPFGHRGVPGGRSPGPTEPFGHRGVPGGRSPGPTEPFGHRGFRGVAPPTGNSALWQRLDLHFRVHGP